MDVGDRTKRTSDSDSSFTGPTSPELAAGRDLQILQSLRRIMRAVDLYSHRLKSQHNLTVPQLVCLRAIDSTSETTVSAIARAAFLSASTVVGILDRLEKRGLIVRQRDTTDRRVVRVRTTDAGRSLIEQAPSPLHDDFRKSLADLSEAEQETIAEALAKIVELMEAEHLEAPPILETQRDLQARDTQ